MCFQCGKFFILTIVKNHNDMIHNEDLCHGATVAKVSAVEVVTPLRMPSTPRSRGRENYNTTHLEFFPKSNFPIRTFSEFGYI